MNYVEVRARVGAALEEKENELVGAIQTMQGLSEDVLTLEDSSELVLAKPCSLGADIFGAFRPSHQNSRQVQDRPSPGPKPNGR